MSTVRKLKKSVAKTDYEIHLTLTPFEAEVVARLMLSGVHWATSGEFGAAAREIHDALHDEGVVRAPEWTRNTTQIPIWSKKGQN